MALAALQGLWTESYQHILDSVVADGLNTVRIPWSNIDLHTPFAGTNELGGVDWSKNADLKGLTTLQVFQKIVEYSGQIGLKVVFDHHTDDGSGGQQPNGSWIDKGPGTDGTDGAGVQGTVDAAKFQADWVEFAKTFAGNPTVIGFDLDNEPTAQNSKWGGGGANDIHKMYQDVGNAVQAVNPGALIIAEGVITADGIGYPMDFSGVRNNPVTLNTPNKVVYSPHNYPAEIGADPRASGQAAIDGNNQQWGWIVKDNIAPIWIGEMGSNMTSPDSQAWASTLLDYMNGKDGAQGGPTFSGNQQGISGSWWNLGWENGAPGTGAGGGNPDGNQDAWGVGHYRPLQQAVTDQMLFRPIAGGGTPPVTPPVTPPAGPPVTPPVTGAGSDTLVLNMSEDAYQGDAQFSVSVDGTQLGAVQSVTASHGQGQSQAFTLKGSFGPGAHSVGVSFLNDAWGGTLALDRNLYIDKATFNGTQVQGATELGINETVSFAATGSAAPPPPVTTGGTLVVRLSEDAWQGDAQCMITVDGKTVGGAVAVTALHGQGQSQSLTLAGSWGAGPHDVGVQFINDAWGGTGATDRNLYVDGVTLDGQASATPPATLLSNGMSHFAVGTNAGGGGGASGLGLRLSEDAWQGDAQFSVAVDGKTLGGAQSVTALHGKSAGQDFAFGPAMAAGTHDVAVSFLNDAWGGTGATDRNLYVEAVSANGTAVPGAAATLLSTGTQHFSVVVAAHV